MGYGSGPGFNPRLDYVAQNSNAVLWLLWTPPDSSKTIPPAARLLPGIIGEAPRLTAVCASDVVTLTMHGESGPGYAIETRSDFSAAQWQTIATIYPLALPFSWSEPVGSSQRYYRIRTVP